MLTGIFPVLNRQREEQIWPTKSPSPRQNGDLEFNLATILNIIWRRRLIVLGLPVLGLVVGMLYGSFGTKRWSATATVRPGITSYSPEGFPVRQWQMKDITTWYDNQLYGQELNARLGLPPEFRTAIRADFIATGLTNLAGGEVVTLWTTGTSPRAGPGHHRHLHRPVPGIRRGGHPEQPDRADPRRAAAADQGAGNTLRVGGPPGSQPEPEA